MQNLIHRKLKSNDGSVLVGVVALSAVLAIAATGLLGVTRNTVNQEVDSHNDARAYLAAEAGLVIGTRMKIGGANTIDQVIVHDGINVHIHLEAGASDAPRRLTATALTAPEILPYNKRLEWMASVNPPASGDDGYAVGELLTDLRRVTVFDGPVHFNSRLRLSTSDMPRFRDDVTVNNTVASIFDLRDGPGTRNNYSRGLTATNVRLSALDDAFRGKYTADERLKTLSFRPIPPLPVAVSTTDPTDNNVVWYRLPTPTTPAFIDGSFLRLGVRAPNGSTHTQTQALGFNFAASEPPCLESRCFTFFQQTATGTWTAFSGTIPTSDTEFIILADNVNLNVRDGKVNGKVTVALNSNAGTNHRINLHLDANNINGGHLTYDGFTMPTGIPVKRQNDHHAANPPDTENWVNSRRATGDNNYNLNAMGDNLLAFYNSRGNIHINTPNPNPGLNLIITGQFLAPMGQVWPMLNRTSINIFGAMSSRYWWSDNLGTTSMNDLNNAVRVFHDRREGMNAAGVIVNTTGSGGGPGGPGGGTGNGELILTVWRERNCLPNDNECWNRGL